MEFLSPVIEDRNEAGQLLADRLVDYIDHLNTRSSKQPPSSHGQGSGKGFG